MAGVPEARRPTSECPPWCRLTHGQLAGEEDVIHISESMCVRNTLVRLCATIDSTTGRQDGPYILMGTAEFTLDEAATLADVVSELVTMGRAVTSPAKA